MIQKIASKIKDGVSFFNGHGATNDHAGRTSLGEVVGTFVKEVKGKLTQGVVGFFDRPELVENLDVCSIEANVQLQENSAGDYTATDVNDITGIALASSNREDPAFIGARRLAMVQAFTDDEPDDNKTKRRFSNMSDIDAIDIPFRDIRRGVKDKKIYAHQLYTEEELRDDREFGKIFVERDTLKEQLGSLTGEYEKLKIRAAEGDRFKAVIEAKDTLKKVLPKVTSGSSSKLTEKQVAYIERGFNPSIIEDLSEEGISKYVEQQLAKYPDDVKFFSSGSNDDIGEPNNPDKRKKGDPTMEEVFDDLTNKKE